MGKGARNRRDPNRGKPESGDMAPDVPMPERATMPWARRVANAGISGFLLQLHYMAAFDDGQGIPSVPAPTGPETAEQRAQRDELTRRLATAHLATADWSGQVADEISHIRPSDASNAVEAMVDIARTWAQDTGYTTLFADHQVAIETQLDGLVAPARRDDVQQLLDIIASADGDVELTRAQHMLIGAATPMPYAALHATAAFGVALWQDPACVPDPGAAQLELARKLHRHLNGDFT